MAVYVIGREDHRMVKIGWALDAEKRLREIGRLTGYPVTLLWQSAPELGVETESKLHRLFRDYRHQGEWFDFGDADPVALVSAAIDLPRGWPPEDRVTPSHKYPKRRPDTRPVDPPLVRICTRRAAQEYGE